MSAAQSQLSDFIFDLNPQSLRVPVIVASEAYKFCEKVQLDSVVYNELGSASEIVSLTIPAVGESGSGGYHANMHKIFYFSNYRSQDDKFVLSVANVLQLCIKIHSIFNIFITVTSDAADLGPVTTPQLQSGYRGAAERLQSDGSEG